MVMILQNVVRSKEHQIYCPGKSAANQSKPCGAEWPFELCKKVAQLTRDEIYEIEDGLAANFAENQIKTQKCPSCYHEIAREGAQTK